jgi:hypothetical protein
MTLPRTNAYYDIATHVDALVSNIRIVPVEEGEPYTACYLDALRGPRGRPKKTRYDVKVVGKVALSLIREYESPVKAGKEVQVQAVLGDTWVSEFTYDAGHPKAGKTGYMLKARLVSISSVAIDGQQVYSRSSPPKEPLKPRATDRAEGDLSPAPAGASDVTAAETGAATDLATAA